MTDKNIILIGFMGTGKSTVGKILAKRLNRVWVDIDQRIEDGQKRKIADIFEKDGEPFFRKIEKEAVRQAVLTPNAVITTGGGVVMDAENMALLKERGLIIALMATPETIYHRVKESRHRPLLKVHDSLAEIKRLLAIRQPYYEKAELRFHTDGKTAAQVAQAIADKLGSSGGADESFEFGKDWF